MTVRSDRLGEAFVCELERQRQGRPGDRCLWDARAPAVKDYLAKNLQIDSARLTTEGFGGTRPVADNSTEDGRAKNRRIELLKKG